VFTFYYKSDAKNANLLVIFIDLVMLQLLVIRVIFKMASAWRNLGFASIHPYNKFVMFLCQKSLSNQIDDLQNLFMWSNVIHFRMQLLPMVFKALVIILKNPESYNAWTNVSHCFDPPCKYCKPDMYTFLGVFAYAWLHVCK